MHDTGFGHVVTGIGDPEQLLVVIATPEFFGVVQTEPIAGRLFAATEEQAAVVVLGYGLWQRKFDGNASAVGQILRLDSVPYTIIGVLPRIPSATTFYVPMPIDAGRDDRASRSLFVMARHENRARGVPDVLGKKT